MDTKLYQDFCALCQDGGQLLCCDGPCLRAFHAECAGLKVLPEGDTWYCPDCTNKQHVCLHCNKVGLMQTPGLTRIAEENSVFPCSGPRCGRFYHLECLKELNDVVTWRKRIWVLVSLPTTSMLVCKVRTNNNQLFRCIDVQMHTIEAALIRRSVYGSIAPRLLVISILMAV